MNNDILARWLATLESRHLSELRLPELTRALRALSSAYVERRHTLSTGGPLDSSGKRAAFALFYAPLHFIAVRHVLEQLGANAPAPSRIIDVGCGTGAAGAAWGVSSGGTAELLGLDRQKWALDEARRTYTFFALRGRTRRVDVTRLPALHRGDAIVASYVLNELPEASRRRLEEALLDGTGRGAAVLVLEPIARAVSPWWDDTARRFEAAGGRADEWRITPELPPLLRRLDKAAGLRHDELTMRSLYRPAR